MSRCPAFTYQLSIMSKWLLKHISSKVTFKITIRKKHVYIDICWPWIWNQCLYLEIWNDERTKKYFASLKLDTQLNSQNRMKMSLLMNSDTLICIWILVYPILIIEVLTPRNWRFWLYFSSLHDTDIQPP